MLAQEPELDDQQPQGTTGKGNSAHDPPSEFDLRSAPYLEYLEFT